MPAVGWLAWVPAMNRKRPLIAIVDDEKAVGQALGRLLRSADFSVAIFGGGEEFLASLSTRRPDCVVLDLHMPEVSGFDVLLRLAAMEVPIPAVTLTGGDSPAVRDRALRSGAAAYLCKPVDDCDLLAAIAAAIGRPRQPSLRPIWFGPK